MRTLRLRVEYDGTDYMGWQWQPQGMTIQQALEEAIERITGSASRVTGSGRTDSGVHARGQVAHFRTESAIAPHRLQAGINALLPRDIVVLALEEAPADFNARFSAKSKRYEYAIWNAPVRPALERRFLWHIRSPLDLPAMRSAAERLMGEHDFAAFESANSGSKTTVRTVTLAEWAQDGPRLVFAIEANGFLYNMVRAIVGSLVEIGRGKQSPSWLARVLASRDRTQAGPTAPAQGLCLMRVDY